MKMSLKSVVAVLAVAAFPLVTVAPASAVDFDRLNFVAECALVEDQDQGDDHVIRADETLTVTLVGCAGLFIREVDDTNNVTMTSAGVIGSTLTEIPSGTVTLTITGEANIDIEYSLLESSREGVFDDLDIDVLIPNEIADPDSTLLETETMTLGLGAAEMMIREEMIGNSDGDNGDGEVLLGGNEVCEVRPGLHVYETLELTVNVGGTYDFRAVGVSPIDNDLNWAVPSYPSGDPYLALYSDFNPADPEAGIVGCNDDADNSGFAEIDDPWYWEDEDESYPGLVTESGLILNHQWSWFRGDLEPGEYTLVYMLYSAMGTTDFGLGQYDASEESDESWDPIAQEVTYEMWGPEGGITISEGLAPTGGVNPAFALWAGLAIVGAGVAIAGARRRELRI
jgi:hypothetical protein